MAGHSKNWVFWAEFVNSGSPVPAGWTWAAAGWASAAVQTSTPRQMSRIRMGRQLSQRAVTYDIPVSRRTGSGFFTGNSGVTPH